MKKAMGMFAALILALGMSGIAYAHWEKIVTVSGTVTTGTLDLVPSFTARLIQTKDVATLDVVVDEKANTVTIKLDNVYPCLHVIGTFDVQNTGSIPAGLKSWTLECTPTVTIAYISATDNWEVKEGDNLIAQVHITDMDDFVQIDPGETDNADFDLHFEEDLPQGKTYTFKLTLTFWNWNEV